MQRRLPDAYFDLAKQSAAYLHDVFVAKFDFWLVFGVGAQLLFAARFRGAVDFLASAPARA